MVDIEADGLAAVKAEIEAAGGEAHAFQADLSVLDEIYAVVERIRSDLGEATILVNNVGRGAREKSSPIQDFDRDFWNFLIDINLRSTIAFSQAVVKGMIASGGGRIVNISSDSAFTGTKAGAPYAAAKGGIVSFTRALARELGKHNINVNSVGPGFTLTRATAAIPEELVKAAISETVLGKLGSVEDIAAAVHFFASDQSNFVTGQTLLVNGGRWFH